MKKIIEVTDELTSIEGDDGNVMKVKTKSLGFTPEVGDEVELNTTDEGTFITKKIIKPPFYLMWWFIIIAYFCFLIPGVLLTIARVNFNNKKDFKVLSIISGGLAALLLVVSFGNSILNSMNNKFEYTVENKSFAVEYEIPATVGKEISIFVGDETNDNNNDGKPDVTDVDVCTTCEIKPGKYELTYVELDDYCSLKVKKDTDTSMYSGTQVFQGNKITLNENQKLSGFNCTLSKYDASKDGGLDVTLKSEDTPKVLMRESVLYIRKPDVNGNIVSQLDFCYNSPKNASTAADNSIINCNELKNITSEKLLSILKNDEGIVYTTTIESIEKTQNGDKCFVTDSTSKEGKKETVCKNLHSYDYYLNKK